MGGTISHTPTHAGDTAGTGHVWHVATREHTTKGGFIRGRRTQSPSQGASGNLPTRAGLLASLPPTGNHPLLGRNVPHTPHLHDTMYTRALLDHGASLCSPRAHTLVVTRTFSLPSRKRSITAALCSTIISPLSSATWWPSFESSAASQLAVLRVWSEKNCF